MSETAFDSSEFLAFIGSPLLVRNEPLPNKDAILRTFLTDVGGITPGGFGGPGTEYASSIYPPDPVPLPLSKRVLAAGFNLGNTGSAMAYPAGWFRVRLIAWGVAPRCNPWVVAQSQTVTIFTGDIQEHTVYRANPEFYITTPGAEPIGVPLVEAVDAFRTPARRAPLNAVALGQSDAPPMFHLFNQRRYVDVSGFSAEAGTWRWGEFGIGVSMRATANLAYQTDLAEFQAVASPGTAVNRDNVNPSNPVLFNGEQLSTFHGTGYNKGMCAVPLAITADTQWRPIAYTDLIMSQVT